MKGQKKPTVLFRAYRWLYYMTPSPPYGAHPLVLLLPVTPSIIPSSDPCLHYLSEGSEREFSRGNISSGR